ncbi:MAG TPA: Gfo/Idh/MocA family oxidoreductase [Gemmatimonadaceae bacterium]|nr:Gfo/Idh/MocA family oxidoreductase [Gemmatimonadaceae bacterium]
MSEIARRDFVKTSATAAVALTIPSYAYAYGAPATIKVGLIGCGGRGTGAIVQAMNAAPEMELVALADLMPERIERAKTQINEAIARDPSLASRNKLTPEKTFSGFDSYRKLLATDVDVVVLATPPGFRPLHLRAAVEAGKHIFAEKPVAVDVAGVRHVLETYELAKAKNLGIGVGTQRRHHPGYIEVMNRVRDGAIGEVLNGQVYWNQGSLWSVEKTPAMSDSEWQIRNWLYFAWLSGDHIVEQHVHNLDVANWVLNATPIRAVGVGGRASRVQPVYGHIFDHFAIDYEYPNGVHVMSMSRQIQGARGRVGEWFQGSKGRVQTGESSPHRIEGAAAYDWQRPANFVQPMQQEHNDLIASIKAGTPRNDLKRIAESTLTAIMGREAAYTGQTIEWDALLKADQYIAPAALEAITFGSLGTPPVPVPGRTVIARKFIEGW